MVVVKPTKGKCIISKCKNSIQSFILQIFNYFYTASPFVNYPKSV